MSRATEYIHDFTSKGGIFAIEHEENNIYSIGSNLEALVEDFAYQHCRGVNVEEPTILEVKEIFEALDNYCLDDNEDGFYDNVELAEGEVLETL